MVTDSLQFGEALCGLPEQLAAAHEAAGKVPPGSLPDASDFDHVVTLGMGGSGIAGGRLPEWAARIGTPGRHGGHAPGRR